MPDNQDIFTKEYPIGSETISFIEEPTERKNIALLDIDEDIKLYGIAKPKRKVIKAKIIDGQS